MRQIWGLTFDWDLRKLWTAGNRRRSLDGPSARRTPAPFVRGRRRSSLRPHPGRAPLCVKSRSEYRDGYKAHIAIEPETGLVTAAALTPTNAPDGSTGVVLLADEEPGLQVLGDGAYGSGETLHALGEAKHQRAIKPWPTTRAVPGGFERTSSWTSQRRPPPPLPVTLSRSRRAELSCSAFAVRDVHSENGAPPPRPARLFVFIHTMAN
jgi:Transposase DDE domain